MLSGRSSRRRWPGLIEGFCTGSEPGWNENGQVLIIQSREKPNWSGVDQSYLIEGSAETKDVSGIFGAIEDGNLLRFRIMLNARHRISQGIGVRGKHAVAVQTPNVIDWFSKRQSQLGFTLAREGDERVALDVMRYRSVRVKGREKMPVCLVNGTMQVVDTAAFERSVRSGVGRGRSYGCGLVSVMPYPQSTEGGV